MSHRFSTSLPLTPMVVAVQNFPPQIAWSLCNLQGRGHSGSVGSARPHPLCFHRGDLWALQVDPVGGPRTLLVFSVSLPRGSSLAGSDWWEDAAKMQPLWCSGGEWGEGASGAHFLNCVYLLCGFRDSYAYTFWKCNSFEFIVKST